MRSYFTTDLLNWYRFRLVVLRGSSLANYGYNPLLTTTIELACIIPFTSFDKSLKNYL